MIIQKLLWRQAYWTELISGFNFVIYYTLSRENKKINLFIHYLNNCLGSNHDD